MIFYYPSFYPSTLPQRSWSHPPSFAVTFPIVRSHALHRSPSYSPLSVMISSIVRDDTRAFVATQWVFVAWRAQIEKKYNPQGG